MSFYEEIAPFYDDIFPAGHEQIELILDAAGTPPARLLDIACGTGVYSVRLAQEGYEVWATDADAEMIRQAQNKAASDNVNVKFFVSDMQEIELHDMKSCFNLVFCIGNSIVHLGSTDAIHTALARMKEHLAGNGSLLLQIINFDRILNKGITSLPTIRNDEKGIVFERKYELDKDTGKIHFDTVLTVTKMNGSKEYSNRVDLFPLTSKMLKSILKDAGFNSIDFYGDFKKSMYDSDESYMLVAVASDIG